jgi:hypothetical protein
MPASAIQWLPQSAAEPPKRLKAGTYAMKTTVEVSDADSGSHPPAALRPSRLVAAEARHPTTRAHQIRPRDGSRPADADDVVRC